MRLEAEGGKWKCEQWGLQRLVLPFLPYMCSNPVVFHLSFPLSCFTSILLDIVHDELNRKASLQITSSKAEQASTV